MERGCNPLLLLLLFQCWIMNYASVFSMHQVSVKVTFLMLGVNIMCVNDSVFCWMVVNYISFFIPSLSILSSWVCNKQVNKIVEWDIKWAGFTKKSEWEHLKITQLNMNKMKVSKSRSKWRKLLLAVHVNYVDVLK